ncbi:MAG: hypothetical protein ABGX63_00720 [bacterium]|jgi:hypothetical protein
MSDERPLVGGTYEWADYEDMETIWIERFFARAGKADEMRLGRGR